jgi:hypothetical protein
VAAAAELSPYFLLLSKSSYKQQTHNNYNQQSCKSTSLAREQAM